MSLKKYKNRPVIVSSIVFITLIYFISLSRYPGWFLGVLQRGDITYSVLVELYYVVPYIGPYLSAFDIISIHFVSGSFSIICYYILKLQLSNNKLVKIYKLPIILSVLSLISMVLGLSTQDCIIGMDKIMENIFNEVIANYIILGHLQLIFIASILSLLSLYYSYKIGTKIREKKSSIY